MRTFFKTCDVACVCQQAYNVSAALLTVELLCCFAQARQESCQASHPEEASTSKGGMFKPVHLTNTLCSYLTAGLTALRALHHS